MGSPDKSTLNDELAKKFFFQALNYVSERKYVQAYETFKKSLNYKRECHACYNLASLMLKRMEFVEAENLVIESIELAKQYNQDYSENLLLLLTLKHITVNFHNKELRKQYLEDLVNRNFDIGYVAKRIIECSFGNNDYYKKQFFLSEIDNIKTYDFETDYPDISDLLQKYNAEYIQLNMQEETNPDYLTKKLIIYGTLAVYEMPILRKIRSQILINIHNTLLSDYSSKYTSSAMNNDEAEFIYSNSTLTHVPQKALYLISGNGNHENKSIPIMAILHDGHVVYLNTYIKNVFINGEFRGPIYKYELDFKHSSPIYIYYGHVTDDRQSVVMTMTPSNIELISFQILLTLKKEFPSLCDYSDIVKDPTHYTYYLTQKGNHLHITNNSHSDMCDISLLDYTYTTAEETEDNMFDLPF